MHGHDDFVAINGQGPAQAGRQDNPPHDLPGPHAKSTCRFNLSGIGIVDGTGENDGGIRCCIKRERNQRPNEATFQEAECRQLYQFVNLIHAG